MHCDWLFLSRQVLASADFHRVKLSRYVGWVNVSVYFFCCYVVHRVRRCFSLELHPIVACSGTRLMLQSYAHVSPLFGNFYFAEVHQVANLFPRYQVTCQKMFAGFPPPCQQALPGRFRMLPNLIHLLRPVKFFSKLNKFILGYFDPIKVFFDNKNK